MLRVICIASTNTHIYTHMYVQDMISALHIASYEGYNEVVKYLTHMKADVNAEDCVSCHVLATCMD